MGEYRLESSIYFILIERVDVVIQIRWLRTQGMISTIDNELFMVFELEGVQYELKGIKFGPCQVISSHGM